MSVRPLEHVVVFLIGFSKQSLVFSFICFGSQKNLPCFFCQRKASTAAFAFRLVLLHGFCDLTNRMADSYQIILKINAVPFEPQQFTAAQTVKRGNSNERQKWIAVKCLEKRL